MDKKKKNLTLFVVAHTETFYNRRHIFSGRADAHLDALGHENAKKLAKKLKNKKFGLVFVSPLSRTWETAKHIIYYHKGVKKIVDPRIIERDYGRLTEKSKDKFAHEHPDKWPIYHRSYDIPPPGGESIKDVEKRVLPFLKEIMKMMREENTNALIVAHSNVLRPIRRYFEHLTPKEMMALEGMYNHLYSYKIPIR